MIPVILVTTASVMLVLELTNTTHFFHKPAVEEPSVTSASQETKGEPSSSNGTNSTKTQSDASQNTSPGDNKATPSSTTNLVAPAGTFVSNHRPSLSANDGQSSNCTTSAGATCQITFTKDGATKSLAAQTTDRAGTTYWSWKPQDIGLSVGTWKIQAVATLNGQTKTADDALNLEIAP